MQLGWRTPDRKRPMGFHAEAADSEEEKETSGEGEREPVFLYGDEGHFTTFAITGGGKGRNVIMPVLLDKKIRGQVLAIDPKGELALVTARARGEIGRVIKMDPFGEVTEAPDCLNPFDAFDLLDGSTEEKAMNLTELLMTDQGTSTKEPFWDDMARVLISALITFIAVHLPPEERHLGTLRKYLCEGDVVYDLAILMDKFPSMTPMAKAGIGQVLQTADVTRAGIVTTAQRYLRILADPLVQASFRKTTFDLQAYIGGECMTIYLILPAKRLSSHATMLRIWIATLMNLLLERKERPAQPTLFLIDEAAQLGKLEMLRVAITLLRSYGLRVWTFWQDLSQIKQLYPVGWQTIINNSSVIQCFSLRKALQAKEMAQILGNISAQEIQTLPPHQQVLWIDGELVIADKLDYLVDEQYQGLYDPNPLYAKENAKKLLGK